jgi:thiamine-monophosphate kinase
LANKKDIPTTLIEDLGEFGLIDHLTKGIIHVNDSTIKGVGDDCCVIDAGNKQVLVTTDMMVYNIHFDLMYTPITHLGYKAITSSISDLYAMNGQAKQVFVSIAVSNQFSVELIDQLYFRNIFRL